MTETPPTPAPSSACPHCGEPLEAGAKFCESCGKPTGVAVDPAAAPAAPVADQASPADDLGSGPISAVTRAAGAGQAPAEGFGSARRPCLQCGGDVGPDGYCDQCGTKAPTERDHFREQPASWVAGVCDRGIKHSRNEDAMAMTASETPGERAVLIVLDGVSNTDDSHIASLAGANAALGVLRAPLPQGMGTPEGRTSAVTKVFTDAVAAANKAVTDTTPEGSTKPPSATFVCGDPRGHRSLVRQRRRLAGLLAARRQARPDAHRRRLGGADCRSRPGCLARRPSRGRRVTPSRGGWARTRPTSCRGSVRSRSRLPVGCWSAPTGCGTTPPSRKLSVDQMKMAGTMDPAALALALTDFANASGGVDNITTVLARVETGQNAADTKTEGESDG